MPRDGCAPSDDALEPLLDGLEQAVAGLAQALKSRDSAAMEQQARRLHVALGACADPFSRAARQGALSTPLRQRLARASAQVTRQRDALHRSSIALDRVLQPLLQGRQADASPAYAAGAFSAPSVRGTPYAA